MVSVAPRWSVYLLGLTPLHRPISGSLAGIAYFTGKRQDGTETCASV